MWNERLTKRCDCNPNRTFSIEGAGFKPCGPRLFGRACLFKQLEHEGARWFQSSHAAVQAQTAVGLVLPAASDGSRPPRRGWAVSGLRCCCRVASISAECSGLVLFGLQHQRRPRQSIHDRRFLEALFGGSTARRHNEGGVHSFAASPAEPPAVAHDPCKPLGILCPIQ